MPMLFLRKPASTITLLLPVDAVCVSVRVCVCVCVCVGRFLSFCSDFVLVLMLSCINCFVTVMLRCRRKNECEMPHCFCSLID